MNVQHLSRSDSWMTPVPVLDLVRRVLGEIDFDPASSVEANERVKAAQFLTREDDALKTPWDVSGKSVFLNPPGGKRGNESMVALFWRRLMEHRSLFRHAVFMGFSVECLQNTQGKGVPAAIEFPLCVPRKRIRFDLPKQMVQPSSPSHSNVVVYIPGTHDVTGCFVDVFSQLGFCKV